MRCEGDRAINEFLGMLSESERSQVQIIMCSTELNKDGFLLRDRQLWDYKLLVPPPNIIGRYAQGDIDYDRYEKEVKHFYAHPKTAYFINELVPRLLDNCTILALCCSTLESDYAYIKILSDFIDEIYGIRSYTPKKYKKNPEKFKKLDSTAKTNVVEIYKDRKENLLRKITELNLSLEPDDRKAILKQYKKRFKKSFFKKIKDRIF